MKILLFFDKKGDDVAEENPCCAILTLPGTQELAITICSILKERYGDVFPFYELELKNFASGENWIHAPETVRKLDVFLIAPMQDLNPNDCMMQLLIACDMLKRASVKSITLILPFVSYMRQDRKDDKRTPVSAKMVFDIISANVLVHHIVTVDLHADQEQGFFDRSLDNLNSRALFAADVHTRGWDMENLMVLSVDFGGAVRAEAFAKRVGDIPVGICQKKRVDGVPRIVNIIGEEIRGRHILIFDDMIDTAGSIVAVVEQLFERGAADVSIYATHGIFSHQAIPLLRSSGVEVVVTDTIPRSESFKKENSDWLRVVSISDLLAHAIHEHATPGGSLSKLM